MKSLLPSFIRFVIYLILMFLCTLPIESDFKLGRANESDAIEISQQIILIATILIGFISLFFTSKYKLFMSILTLFISIHLIRENDVWLETKTPIIDIGWFTYVLIILVIMLVIILKNYKTFKHQIKSASQTLGFGILLISLAFLHVFTRIYGKPSNWENIMGDQYLYSVERASEESVELVAYMILLIAVVELFIFVKNDKLSS